jgi:uncharacterized protein (TIGR00661 family)
MKILYAIQGTGNGHLSRALEIIPILKKKGTLDILVSGTQADISLPHPVKYRLRGLSFIFGKKGGIDLWNTFLRNGAVRALLDIRNLPVEQYDLIINDFEPISAWAAYLKGKPCVALSHQCAVLSENAPVPERINRIARFILSHYAPSTFKYGFHFNRYNEDTYTPVIRKQVRELVVSDRGHYTVYLPSISDKKLMKTFKKFRNTNWEVFSKHTKKTLISENISLMPINHDAFIKSLASCSGIICGAGFETPSEALFLKKKLLVIPMKNQYEQHCNAAALKTLGVPVIKNLKEKKIDRWLLYGPIIHVNFPNQTESIVDLLIKNHVSSNPPFLRSKLAEYAQVQSGVALEG